MKNIDSLVVTLFTISILFINLNCQPSKTATDIATVAASDTILPNETWMQHFNDDYRELAYLYLDNPIMMDEEGYVYNSESKNLMDYIDELGSIGSGLKSIKTLKLVKATPDIAYEIGTFETAANDKFHHLIVWNMKQEQPLRELEVIAVSEDVDWKVNPIDARREQWIKLCNEHNAAALVNDLYSENAVYYNHQPADIGREAITERYSYMNRPEYKLHLEPIIHEVVSKTIAFEIGQCSGSYSGKYVLVWKLDDDGVWRVLMDTNV